MSEHPHHVVPVKVYVAVFLALCAFTVLTVSAAGHDFGALNTPIALVIAITKATLVILYFMHVRYSPRLIWLVVGGSLAWLGVLVIITMTDYASRGWLPFPGK